MEDILHPLALLNNTLILNFCLRIIHIRHTILKPVIFTRSAVYPACYSAQIM